MFAWETAVPAGYEWLIFLARIVLAILLGFAIGFERKMRVKEAGVRTHSMVAAGACLFMIISKYGFSDIKGNYDAARIAAQVISGVGFLGAGMIMYKKQAIHGLTTAAGVWVTAGIGMAAGAGMYIVAVASTVVIIAVQCIMHINCSLFQMKRFMQLKIVFLGSDENIENIKRIFDTKTFYSAEASKSNEDEVVFTIIIRTAKIFDANFIHKILSENPFILSIERTDEED